MSEFKVGDQVIAYGSRKAEIIEVKNGAINAAYVKYKDTGEKAWCPLLSMQLDKLELTTALTRREKKALGKYEGVIQDGLGAFMKVGKALQKIRDNRLYRADHPTFEDYLAERWNVSRSRAYQLMSASTVTQTLSTNVDTPPANEAQARPMTTVPADQQVEVWREIEETAPDGKITAAHVTQVVQSRRFYRPTDRLIYQDRTYEVIGVRGNQRLNIRDIETKAMIFDIDPADVQDPHTVKSQPEPIPPVVEPALPIETAITKDEKSADAVEIPVVKPPYPFQDKLNEVGLYPYQVVKHTSNGLVGTYTAIWHGDYTRDQAYDLAQTYAVIFKAQSFQVIEAGCNIKSAYVTYGMNGQHDPMVQFAPADYVKPVEAVSSNGKVAEPEPIDPKYAAFYEPAATPIQGDPDKAFQTIYAALQVVPNASFSGITAKGFTVLLLIDGVEIIVRPHVFSPQSEISPKEMVNV